MNHVLKYWTGHDSHILFVTFSEIQFASKQHDIIFSFISLQLGSLLQKIMHDEGEFSHLLLQFYEISTYVFESSVKFISTLLSYQIFGNNPMGIISKKIWKCGYY